MLATFVGLLLFLWAISAAICALYTPFAFGVLNIDTFALHVVNGTLTIDDLIRYERFSLVFSQGEINHFADVARAVGIVRGSLFVFFATVVALIWLRPDLRGPATTRAIVLFGLVLTATGLGYMLAGYNATSDFLHGFAFRPGSHVFTADSLTGHIYSNDDMIAGALLVMVLIAFAMAGAWLTARLSFPWPAKNAQKATAAQAKRGDRR